ncbi:MAG: hypothetical protein U0T81_10465 [Saprospiraceae bacterium]
MNAAAVQQVPLVSLYGMMAMGSLFTLNCRPSSRTYPLRLRVLKREDTTNGILIYKPKPGTMISQWHPEGIPPLLHGTCTGTFYV